MGIIGKDFDYKIIDNFLDKGEVNLLNQYCEIMHRTNTSKFDFRVCETGDTMCHGDPVFDALLLTKKDIMEKTTGLKLLPTYTFWRMYTKHAILRKHTDRPACEISATVHIGSDGTSWPIFMDDKPLHTKPGDAAVYLGAKVPHHRERFTGDWHAQIFLHYVEEGGPHANEYMDGRVYWGADKYGTKNWRY
jgi:hypothetical protein